MAAGVAEARQMVIHPGKKFCPSDLPIAENVTSYPSYSAAVRAFAEAVKELSSPRPPAEGGPMAYIWPADVDASCRVPETILTTDCEGRTVIHTGTRTARRLARVR